VGPELLESFVEHLFVHPDLLLEGRLFLRLGLEPGEDHVQHGHIRVVALKEEIVGVAIGVGVHQDRAARPTVAPGASDFLVISFHASRQGRVDHRADVGFIDPMPDAMVATMISIRPSRNSSWTLRRR